MEKEEKKETYDEILERLKSKGLDPKPGYTGIANDFDFHYREPSLRDFFLIFGIDIKKIKYKLQGKEMPKYDDRGRELGKI